MLITIAIAITTVTITVASSCIHEENGPTWEVLCDLFSRVFLRYLAANVGNWYKDKNRVGCYMCKSCYVCFNRKKLKDGTVTILSTRKRRDAYSRDSSNRVCLSCFADQSSGDW